ncbi:MAG: glycoside hydrolase family 3 protein [Armatimonadota bacterium]
MTLEQKIGQMFMLAFAGTTIDDAAVLVREHFVGACYLSNDNFTDPGQAARLAAGLQALAREAAGMPLLLAADQEGAWAVLTPYSCPGPGNLGLGATWSVEHTRAMYAVFGVELRAVGMNADLAPVADTNTNPANPIIGMRSFGEQPDLVAAHVRAAIEGLHSAGVCATAKHFPGHGDTTLDSHRGLATVDRDVESLEEREFRPFREAVAAGVDIVMTSHVIFPAIDPVWPATLSPPLLTGLLRGTMGFDGVILTDSFNMGAMRRMYGPVEAVVRTVQAGADMILLAEERYGDERGRYLDNQVRLIRGLSAAVRRGEVDAARIDDAVLRIRTLKQRHDLAASVTPNPADAARAVGSPEHRGVERRAAEAAVVLVQNRGGVVPLRVKPDDRIVVLSATDPEGFTRMAGGRGIGPNVVERPFEVAFQEIKRRHRNTEQLAVHPERLDAALALAQSAAVVVVITEKYPLAGFDFPDDSQHRFVHLLAGQRLAGERRARVIVLACRDPYELAGLADVDAYICAVGYRPPCVAAGVGVLFGEIRPQGRLPVSVPGLYPSGWRTEV